MNSFYQIRNGFYYDGINIFSVRPDETAEHLDIHVRQVEWDIAERLPGFQAFGRSDEQIYIYNQPKGKFQILDYRVG